MIEYFARLLDITMNNKVIPGDEESYSVSHLQRGRSIGSWKLLTGKLNLGGLQTNAARYSRVPKTNLGNEWVDKRGSA